MSWWNKWKQKEENEQKIRDKLATLGTPCVIEKNKIDNNTKINQNLNLAINNLDIELIKTLIQNGEDINKKDGNGNTPLMNIIMANNISNKFKQYEMIDLLLEKDADVYIKNNFNFNILEIMEHKEYYVEIRKIFEKYNYFKNTKNENDKYLISLENKDNFKSSGKIINSENKEDYYTQKLKYAIKNLDVKIITSLIENVLNVDIQDDDNNTSLIVAVKNFDLKLTKLLIEKNANKDIVNNNGETALSIAKKRGYKKIIDLLDNKNDFKSKEIKNIIDINMALKSKNFDLVIELIKRREEIDKKDENGNTPLMNIVMANNISDKFKQYEMIDLLLKEGADVYIKNNYNFNILEIMEHKEYYTEIRKIFEKYDYFKNTKNENDKYLTSLKESTIKKIDLSSNIDNLKNKLKSNQINENIKFEEFYIKIKQLTILLRKTKIMRGIGKTIIDEPYYDFTTTINSIYVNVHAKAYPDSKVRITMKIGEQNYSIEDDSNDKSINSFNENIKVIFIDTIDKTIELLQNKVTKIQDEKNIKDTQQKTLIEKLAQDINNQASLKKENEKYSSFIDNKEGLKSTIELQFKTIKKLEEDLRLQSKEIDNLKKDSKDKESKQAQQLDELVSKIEKFDKIEVQSKIIQELDNQLLLQSKIIKNLEEHLRSQSNEINKIKKDYKQEQTVYQNELLKKIENFDDMEIQLKNIKNLDNQLLSQSKEIYNIKKEFLDKEIKQTLYINELVQKIEKLEELLKNKPSNKSEKRPLDIPIQLEKQTINKTDGELIKRDSFDDF